MGKLNPYQLVRLIHSFGVQNKQIDPVVSLCLGPCEISVGRWSALIQHSQTEVSVQHQYL